MASIFSFFNYLYLKNTDKTKHMERRELILSMAAAYGGLAFGSSPAQGPRRQSNFSVDGNHVRFYHSAIRESFVIIMLADTHLFRDDERGEAFRTYSGRMAKAYNKTVHFQTLEATHPEACFEETLAIAAKENARLLALVGDIFSFPSEAAIAWAAERLEKAGLPWLYVAGNHDWHYEGMPGSLAALRDTWTQKRLLRLYQNEHPLMTSREIGGVRFVALDNSDYQVTEAQLAFFQQEIALGKPVILMVHIPLYAPGRPVGFGCGHPDWGASTDENHALERRERWPETGHSTITRAFHKAVLAAPNLLGVLAGHIHTQSLDVMDGLPQIVTRANANGAYLKVEFLPFG
jgi:predicted phosphodiesterase